MEKIPRREQVSIANIQLRLNKDLESLEARREMPTFADAKWAEGILDTIDSLLEDKNIQNSEQDKMELFEKKKKVEDFIEESRENLE